MRKKFLIKPALQFKHLAWTLGVAAITFLACYTLFERQIGLALMNGSLDVAHWAALRGTFRLGFFFALLILLGMIGIENYLFFHTIAGPIYALEKGLRRLAAGDFNDVTKIRDYDQLGELIESFEHMKKQIAARIETQEKTAHLLARELDRLLTNTSVENIAAMRAKLKELREQVEKKAA